MCQLSQSIAQFSECVCESEIVNAEEKIEQAVIAMDDEFLSNVVWE